ncbi:uncharacterized protein LOC130990071 [Salvia miltiorrhiza]|uniref:uncharacterized protein LOC130990071 n=1 Tax=Salvia miltiorrhiza TaxID=226208 RepID=UPI0025AD3714|nr:uncharacterized protein LOC130990071 [Salvia miltiorrhiza]
MVVHQVVSRQIKSSRDGLFFLLNNTRVHFSKRDYALVTGLNFGDFNVDMSRNHDLSGVEVFNKFNCDESHVKLSTLIDLFENFEIDDEDGSLYLRIAYIIVLYGMLVGYETDKTIEHWVWALVDDLDAFNQFPWGAYTYNLLCYYTTNCKSKKQYKLYGPVWALHVWSLEIVPDLGNVVGNCVAEFAHPRCLKWMFRSRPATKDLRPFFEKEEQEILELVADEFEVSTMYYLSTIGVYMGAQHDEARVYMGAQHDEAPNQDFPYGPSHDIHVEEQEQEEGGALHDIPISAHDLAATVMDTRARSSSSHEEGRRRRAREKRVRPPTTSSHLVAAIMLTGV